MKKFLVVLCMSALSLGGCITAPDEKMSLDDQRVFQVQQVINQMAISVSLLEVYVAASKKDWDEDKIAEFESYIFTARNMVDTAQKLLNENNFASAETQKILFDALIREIEARSGEDLQPV